MPRRNSLILAGLAGLTLLAGCGPLVQIGGNSKPPPALQTLRSDAPPVSARTDPRNTLLVAVPAVTGAIQTLRLAVTTSDTEISYWKDTDFNWSEQPAKLFQHVLADTAASKAGVTILDARQADVAPVRKLTGVLVDFGLDVRNPSAPVAHIRYDATLSGREGKLFATRRFEATEPVASQTGPAIGAALNRAANHVATDVAGWIAAN